MLQSLFTNRAEMSKKRLDICNDCEHFIKKTFRCEKCGCFMNYKTLFARSECPIGKWGKEKEEDNG